ncbi:hypothetical protein GCM10010307_87880 [Streptomyces vastus]|uniref:Uncharacterized protein n=1 Tax=Streptomyces vastus TaxID=285451 RepID=A0ABP6ED11_9ACTN
MASKVNKALSPSIYKITGWPSGDRTTEKPKPATFRRPEQPWAPGKPVPPTTRSLLPGRGPAPTHAPQGRGCDINGSAAGRDQPQRIRSFKLPLPAERLRWSA